MISPVAVICFALFSVCFSSPVQQSWLADRDPEIDMKPDEIIQRWGYKAEYYEVTTEDGYILPLYRIPHGRNAQSPSAQDTPRPVVYLQHGLENSAADWVINLPTQSAGFIFADAGFDVWIGNFRGTMYSKRHTSLSPKDHKFWQFSWDEMAMYDLPALLNKTMEVSGAERVYYVAHSMGTMAGFAKFSTDPALAKKIRQFYAIGPVLQMKHVEGPVKYAAPFTKYLGMVTRLFGVDEFLPNTKLQQEWAKYVCPEPLTDLICKNVILMISGPDTHQINATRMPVIDSHSPAGTSVQNVLHFGQMVNSGLFQAYDYGSKKDNQAHYGQDKPPVYDVTKMQVPVILYSGNKDYLSTTLDVANAASQFPNVVDNVILSDFNHMDFVWGVRGAPLVFNPIMKSIKQDFQA